MGKLFGTDGVRGIANVYPMTPEMALKLGQACACVLNKGKKDFTILIGKDTRLSGYLFENALTAGLLSQGAKVLLVGPMPTPAISHLVKSFAADGGIMISASHNPPSDNGIKFFGADGFKLNDDMEEKIEALCLGDEIPKKSIGRAIRIDDARGRYIEYIKGTIDNRSLKGLKIVIDCANGAGYSVSPMILKELGAEVIAINNEPNGLNINVECGSTNPASLSKKVIESRADLGIALDGDADRVILVDEKGKIVDGDFIMAIMAADLSARKLLKKNTIVVTEYTNSGLAITLKNLGIKMIRSGNGDRAVLLEMQKNGLNFGGEKVGHIVLLDYATAGDGTLCALHVCDMMKRSSKKISELASILVEMPSVLVNIQVTKKIPFEKMPRVLDAINGAKKSLKEGRVHVRYSGTEMKIRILIEGSDRKKIEVLAEKISKPIRDELT